MRFERAGLKTLSTAFAPLEPAAELPAIDRLQQDGGWGWLGEAASDPAQVMIRLPESAKDPFRPADERMIALLRLYRFEASGSRLIDWAAAQSGLADPLTRFSRPELEQLFARFRLNLDREVAHQAADLRRRNPGALTRALAAAPAEAASALKRLDIAC